MDWRWGSIIAVWVLAMLGAVAIGLTPARDAYWTWIPVAFGLCVVATLAIQVFTKTPTGYVHRAVVSILGALVVFVVATVVFVLALG